jgi:glutaminyl-tRNA synthetase
MGNHKIKLTKTVYIERADFSEIDDPEFFRLSPNQPVGLFKAPYPVVATSFKKDGDKVTEIRAVYDKSGKKPKTFIHWVAEGSRVVEVREYNALFKSEKPDDVEGGFLNNINPNSEVVWPKAMIESGFDEVRARAPWPEAAGESELGKGGPESVRFQAMRVAYMVSLFCP